MAYPTGMTSFCYHVVHIDEVKTRWKDGETEEILDEFFPQDEDAQATIRHANNNQGDINENIKAILKHLDAEFRQEYNNAW